MPNVSKPDMSQQEFTELYQKTAEIVPALNRKRSPKVINRPEATRVTKRIDNALRALVDGAESLTLASEKAKISITALSRALSQPHVVERLYELMAQKAMQRGMRALAGIEKLSTEAKSEYVRLQALQDLANRSRLSQPEQSDGQGNNGVSFNVNISLGSTSRTEESEGKVIEGNATEQ